MTTPHKSKTYAVAYARVSTDDKDQNPESQLMAIRKWAKDREVTILSEFQDHSTGTNTQRKGLSDLMGYLQMNALDMDPGKVTMVIVHDMDRLSRSMKDTNKLLDLFDRLGVRLMNISNEGLDTRTAEGMVVAAVNSYAAQNYTDHIKGKIRDGIARARAEGKQIGRPLKKGADKIDIKSLLIQADAGYSMNEIAIMHSCSRMTIARRLKAGNALDEFKARYAVAVAKLSAEKHRAEMESNAQEAPARVDDNGTDGLQAE